MRRALGRLVGSARVRDLPPERLAVTAPVSTPGGIGWPDCLGGEGAWRPSARVAADPLPRPSAGSGGADLAAVATVIGMNGALRPEAVDVFAAPPLPAACAAHRLDVLAATATTHQAAVTLSGAAVRAADARVAAPPVRRLPMDPPALPRPSRRFGRRPAPADAWRLAGATVRVGTARAADVPMTRARLPVAPGDASGAERRRLADAAGIAPDDVVLLGVFPQVPVAAVRRLALADGGGALSLWLKPEALALAAAGKSPRLATLVLGRQRSTGKMLQTVA